MSLSPPPSNEPIRRSGKRRRKSKSHTRQQAEGDLAITLRMLASPVEVTINGKKSRLAVFEAIMLQLWHKELAGDRRALETRLRYETLARTLSGERVQTVFVDSDYTMAVAAAGRTKGSGKEP